MCREYTFSCIFIAPDKSCSMRPLTTTRTSGTQFLLLEEVSHDDENGGSNFFKD